MGGERAGGRNPLILTCPGHSSTESSGLATAELLSVLSLVVKIKNQWTLLERAGET